MIMTLNDLESNLSSGNYNLYITDITGDDEVFLIEDRENKTGTEIFAEIRQLPLFVLHKTLSEMALTAYIKGKYSLSDVCGVYVVKDGLIVALEVD